MARYLVTGCAGFIGSHLTEALLARGDEVVGVDAFTDYYERELKERNLAAAREHAGVHAASRPISPRPSCRRCSTASTASSTSPRSRACARAGASASTSTSTTTSARRSGCFEAASAAGVARRLRVVVVRLRRRRALPDARGRDAGAASRRTASRSSPARSWRASTPRSFGLRRRRRCATSPSTARASGPTWRSPASSRAPARRGRSSCSATGSSRATSRTSTDAVAATIAAFERGARQARLQRRRRQRDDAPRGDPAARGARRHASSTRVSPTAAAGDVHRTAADTSAAPRGDRLGAAGAASATGSARNSTTRWPMSKVLVTGGGGLHRLAPRRRAARARRRRARARQLLDRRPAQPAARRAAHRDRRGRPTELRARPDRGAAGARSSSTRPRCRRSRARSRIRSSSSEVNVDGHAQRPARGARRGRPARRLRVVVVRLRLDGADARSSAKTCPSRRCRPYGVAKFAGEAYCSSFHAGLRARDGLAALLQRLRPAPEPDLRVRGRHPELLRRGVHGRAAGRLRRRRAVARLHVRRQRRRGEPRGGRGRPALPARRSTSPAARRTRSTRSSRHIARLVGRPLEPVHEPARVGEVRMSLADIDKARRLLGVRADDPPRRGAARAPTAISPRMPRCSRRSASGAAGCRSHARGADVWLRDVNGRPSGRGDDSRTRLPSPFVNTADPRQDVHRVREHDPNQARYGAAERLLPEPRRGTLLELGGGIGAFAERLAGTWLRGRLHRSERERIVERAAEAGFEHARLDLNFPLPFEDASFDGRDDARGHRARRRRRAAARPRSRGFSSRAAS